MDNHVTLKTVRSRLDEMGMDYVLLPHGWGPYCAVQPLWRTPHGALSGRGWGKPSVAEQSL